MYKFIFRCEAFSRELLFSWSSNWLICAQQNQKRIVKIILCLQNPNEKKRERERTRIEHLNDQNLMWHVTVIKCRTVKTFCTGVLWLKIVNFVFPFKIEFLLCNKIRKQSSIETNKEMILNGVFLYFLRYIQFRRTKHLRRNDTTIYGSVLLF